MRQILLKSLACIIQLLFALLNVLLKVKTITISNQSLVNPANSSHMMFVLQVMHWHAVKHMMLPICKRNISQISMLRPSLMRLKTYGLNVYIQFTKPLLINTHKQKWLEWAKDHINWSADN